MGDKTTEDNLGAFSIFPKDVAVFILRLLVNHQPVLSVDHPDLLAFALTCKAANELAKQARSSENLTVYINLIVNSDLSLPHQINQCLIANYPCYATEQAAQSAQSKSQQQTIELTLPTSMLIKQDDVFLVKPHCCIMNTDLPEAQKNNRDNKLKPFQLFSLRNAKQTWKTLNNLNSATSSSDETFTLQTTLNAWRFILSLCLNTDAKKYELLAKAQAWLLFNLSSQEKAMLVPNKPPDVTYERAFSLQDLDQRFKIFNDEVYKTEKSPGCFIQ